VSSKLPRWRKEFWYSPTITSKRSSPNMKAFSLNSTPHGGKYLLNIINLMFNYSGHCKKLAPEFSAAAEVLAKNDPPMFLGKVDATVEKDLGEKYGVQGFPTLIYFK
jgi:thiol-disulfide isomerase/thioredoxin